MLKAAIYLPTQTFRTLRSTKHLRRDWNPGRPGEKGSGRTGTGLQHGFVWPASWAFPYKTGYICQCANERVPVRLQHSDKTKNALTDDEIVEQTALLLIAGQDTTANTLAFGLLELAKLPELQIQLRDEIHSTFGNAGAGGVAYDSMPLLNAFIKELLRFYPTEPIPQRVAIRDSVIPLMDGIKTTNGELISEILIRKGQIVMLGVAAYHRLESRWGTDALEFKPARWLYGYKGEAVGPYANPLSFLGGPRTCLG
ncbi:cytochrome P450 [Mycena capillaripes]|nr:cytochrome P450 [Mycena capillaripes]